MQACHLAVSLHAGPLDGCPHQFLYLPRVSLFVLDGLSELVVYNAFEADTRILVGA